MITSVANSGNYLRAAQPSPSRMIFTTADAQPAPDAGAAEKYAQPGIPVSSLKAVDVSQLKIISVKDNPELRDLMATNWLKMRADEATFATSVPDNAPQNIYATVKVEGKVVATLYNAGSVAMTNEAGGKVGDLQDPPGLGGPDLAQWRAKRIAEVVGGMIERAPTAIAQSEWKPRESTSSNYSRAQLDAAFEAMMAEQSKAAVQRSASYQAPRETSSGHTDFNA